MASYITFRKGSNRSQNQKI